MRKCLFEDDIIDDDEDKESSGKLSLPSHMYSSTGGGGRVKFQEGAPMVMNDRSFEIKKDINMYSLLNYTSPPDFVGTLCRYMLKMIERMKRWDHLDSVALTQKKLTVPKI